MNIIEALDDPTLFARHFRGDTWGMWRLYLKLIFGLPISEAEYEAFRHHTGRTVLPTEPFKEIVTICGRRGGKSRVLALIATYLAAFKDYAPFLAPGEVATIAVIAADRKQARSIFRFILGLVQHTDLLRPLVESETADSLTLTNGVVIEIHSASFRVTRGYSLAAALCDEVAFWRSEESANPDSDILAALRPGLSNIPGAKLLVASSPYAKRGALYQAWKDNWGRNDARVLVWKGSTAEMNPQIDPALIAQAYEDDPANAAAEYGAEFRGDIAAFVTREVVDACTALGRYELPYLSSERYHAFVDPSGGSADSMTLAIAHNEGTNVVLDLVREVRPPFSPEGVVADFAAVLKDYRLRSVTGDRYAGEWVREPFQLAGIDYKLSEKTKVQVYQDCLPLLNSRRLELLELPRLASQLCGLERRTARGGRDAVRAGVDACP